MQTLPASQLYSQATRPACKSCAARTHGVLRADRAWSSSQPAVRSARQAAARWQLQALSVDQAAAEAKESVDELQKSVQEAISAAGEALSGSFDQPLPEHPVGWHDKIDIGESLNGDVIRVPDDFEARQGLKLTDEYMVGKEIGGGVQGRVFTLEGPNGEDTGKLLKVMKYKAATPITGLDIGLKREWMIGQQLNTLTGDDGKLHGFMGTGAALIGESDDTTMGLVIEKVNGWALAKRVAKDEDFVDIHYLLEGIKQIFSYLDYAYKEIGFTHGDLNTENVMEHREGAPQLLPRGYSTESPNTGLVDAEKHLFKLEGDKGARQLEFRIIDYGHAKIYRKKDQERWKDLPEVPEFERVGYRSWWENKGDVWRLLQDLAVQLDGRTWAADDEPEVRYLIGLIREVTGVTIAAFFRSESVGTVRYSGKRAEMPWHDSRGFGHDIRKLRMRFWAFSFERKTQMKPAEALQWLVEKYDYYQQKYGGAKRRSNEQQSVIKD